MLQASRHAKYGLAFISPALLYFLLFWSLPAGLALGYSLTDWRIGQLARFVGLRNYLNLLLDPLFRQSVQASLTITGLALSMMVPLALGLALLLNDERLRFGRLFKLIIMLPVVTDWVATGLIWQLVFLPHQGVLAGFFVRLHLHQWIAVRWTASRQLAPVAVAIFTVWKMTGLYAVFFLAGLRSIPRQYLEAAVVDGATGVQAIRHVALPLLRPITVFVLVSAFVVCIGLFEPVFMLTGGGPGDATRTLPIFLYENFFQLHRAGYASAGGVLFLLLCLTFALVAGWQLRYSFYE